MWAIAAAVALITVVAATVMTVAKPSLASSSVGGYQRKVTAAFRPLLSANTSLSSSLQSLTVAGGSISEQSAAVTKALAAVASTQTTLGKSRTPASDRDLSLNVQRAIASELSYLQEVSSALDSPSSNAAAELPLLASDMKMALIAIDRVAPSGAQSIAGTDTLVAWVNSAVGDSQTQNGGTQTSVNPNSGAGSNTGDGSQTNALPTVQNTTEGDCNSAPDQENLCVTRNCPNSDVTAYRLTDCQFAVKVEAQYRHQYEQQSSIESGWVMVYSDKMSESYRMGCHADDGANTVDCIGGKNDTARVTFPLSSGEA